jgi:hypothetical protein
VAHGIHPCEVDYTIVVKHQPVLSSSPLNNIPSAS